jgi:Ca2+-binding EF-hand superfamily protein
MYARLLLATILAVLGLCVGAARAQPPGVTFELKIKNPAGPPDEDKEILKEIKEAYKAPFEVHEDVLKELRRQYEQPSPDREAKIFKELRRLYDLTSQQEEILTRELRVAYRHQSPEQEERIFRMLQQAERLSNGAVPRSVQAEQARKIFQKLDRDGDGVLSADEMPDTLRAERGRWDTNHDGVIDPQEYWAYYQSRLGSLSDQVAAGEIDLGLKRGGPAPKTATTEPKEEPRPTVFRAGKLPAGLPDWFRQLDTDGDGQIGLYEWRAGGRTLEEFTRIDRNDDGFLTPEEVLFYIAQQSRGGPNTSDAARPQKVPR